MKARLEMITGSEQGAKIYPGWLFLHDIAMPIPRAKLKAWLRVCLFQAMDYDYRMYAYENDVLYDFTSFMYYGKGARGVLMLNWEPLSWLEIWARYARVSYAGRTIGTGLEAIEGSQLNEFEFQVMLRDPF
jgi:hypothetical protein